MQMPEGAVGELTHGMLRDQVNHTSRNCANSTISTRPTP